MVLTVCLQRIGFQVRVETAETRLSYTDGQNSVGIRGIQQPVQFRTHKPSVNKLGKREYPIGRWGVRSQVSFVHHGFVIYAMISHTHTRSASPQ